MRVNYFMNKQLLLAIVISITISITIGSFTIYNFSTQSFDIQTPGELIKIDEHSNVLEKYQFSTLSGFKIIDESTILVNFNNSNNNAYFLGGKQIEQNIETFAFDKEYQINDLIILNAKQHDDIVIQIFKLKSINNENHTVTFTHFASHLPLTDNLLQKDYVGKVVMYKSQ